MNGEWIATLGDAKDFDRLFTGKFLKGRAEPRIAIVGRSNVGKSSLINAMLGRSVAQTSNRPGKTTCIHFYLWNDLQKIIADLPGYGFAKAAQSERQRWAEFIDHYLERDEMLERALVLLDARHGPTDKDLAAIRFLSSKSVPVTFVFTKFDALKTQKERAERLKTAGKALRDAGCEPSSALWVSSKTGAGLHLLEKEIAGRAPPTATV